MTINDMIWIDEQQIVLMERRAASLMVMLSNGKTLTFTWSPEVELLWEYREKLENDRVDCNRKSK